MISMDPNCHLGALCSPRSQSLDLPLPFSSSPIQDILMPIPLSPIFDEMTNPEHFLDPLFVPPPTPPVVSSISQGGRNLQEELLCCPEYRFQVLCDSVRRVENLSSQPLHGRSDDTTDPERLMHDIRSAARCLVAMRKRKASSGKVEGSEEKEKSEAAPDFECNICFELAKEPVVTCCGHLFCWPCLYQWLNVHSSYQECPVCKGKVNESGIVPIYGRGGSEASTKKNAEEEGNPELKVPPRPQGNRVESLRQQLDSWSRSVAAIEHHLQVSFDETSRRIETVPWQLTRHGSPNTRISVSSSVHQDGATSQQRAADPIGRLAAIFTQFRSLNRRSDDVVGIISADNHRDPEPVVSQTSNSSTIAMIQGVNAAAIGASAEPNRGGSSMVLRGTRRRRRRSTGGVSHDNTSADNDASDGTNRRGSSMALRRRGRNSTGDMEGDTSADTNASEEPNGGGFTMVLRRRSRSRTADSSSTDHGGQRRRLD